MLAVGDLILPPIDPPTALLIAILPGVSNPWRRIRKHPNPPGRRIAAWTGSNMAPPRTRRSRSLAPSTRRAKPAAPATVQTDQDALRAKLTDATVAPTMPVHVLGHFNPEMLRQIAAPIGDAGGAFVQA